MGKEGTAFADLLYQQAFSVELTMSIAAKNPKTSAGPSVIPGPG